MTHYHRYQYIAETADGIVEVCTECKKKLVTKKDKNSRIDNEAYRKEHIADTAQPRGPTQKIFEQLYGDKAFERDKQLIKRRKQISNG